MPLPLAAHGILAVVAENRSLVSSLAVNAQIAQRTQAARMYERADEALRKALIQLVCTVEAHRSYANKRYLERHQPANAQPGRLDDGMSRKARPGAASR